MKIEVLTNTLLTKLTFINKAISTRNHLPILLNILIETRNDKLVLSSTDLEIGIESEIDAKIVEEGSIAVPARSFTELINTISTDTVSLSTVGSILNVTSEKIKTVFQTMPGNEFPKLYEDKGVSVAEIDHNTLRNTLSKVVFAASSDTAKPTLSGVLVGVENDSLFLVATDGFRLSISQGKATSIKSKTEDQLIVPARVLKELMGIKNNEKKIEMLIAADNKQIHFNIGGDLLIGRLIEAEFPKYEKIIPTDFSLRTVFEREEFLKAVKICSIFARDTASIINLKLKKESVVVSASSQSVGENTVEIDAKFEGEENEIAFNSRYLLDLAGALTSEKMILEMMGPLNPGVFKEESDQSFLHLIMPIRTV